MKKMLFCLVAAMFLAACEKDSPEQVVTDPEPEREQPEVEMFERRVIKLPAELPENVDQRQSGITVKIVFKSLVDCFK